MKQLLTDILNLVRKYRRLLIRLAIVGVMLNIVAMAGSFLLTSQPWFCNSCHYMKPYVRSWKTSKHNMVACPKCHFSSNPVELFKEKTNAMATTFRYFVGTYDTRPSTEVPDEHCLQSGCHETRLLAGKEKVPFKKGILFSHKEHLTGERRGIKLRCTSCHSQIVQGSHIAVTESVCFTCHFYKTPKGHPLGGCENCHHKPEGKAGPNGFEHEKYVGLGVECTTCHVQVTRGSGNVPEDRCYNCHMEKDRQKYDKETIHTTHVTEHKVECFDCHEPIEHGLNDIMKTVDSTCGECHTRERDLFTGMSIGKTAAMPSPMFKARVACESCHTGDAKHPTSIDKAQIAQACNDCHGNGYGKLIDEWLAMEDTSEAALRKLLADANEMLSSADLSAQNNQALDKAVKNANEVLKLFSDGSGVHNIEFALKALDDCRRDLTSALAACGEQEIATTSLIASNKDIRSCIKTCHLSFGSDPTVTYDGKKFPHSVHIEQEGYTCDKCHSSEPVHGVMKITAKDCTSCHHEKKQDCQTCHTRQAAMLTGHATHKLMGSNEIKPGPMSEGVACEDCHTQKATPADAPHAVAAACDECHKEGTGKLMIQLWQMKTRTIHQRQTEQLHDVQQEGKASSALLDDVRIRLDAVREDGSWGVHNPTLTDLLLMESSDLLDEANKASETPVTAPGDKQ